VNIVKESDSMVGSTRGHESQMAESAIDYVNLTRICEFTRALHQFHQIGGDEVIDREFNAVCRAIWGYSLDDFTDDDLSPNDHWLAR
jgi:hypothetical protein